MNDLMYFPEIENRFELNDLELDYLDKFEQYATSALPLPTRQEIIKMLKTLPYQIGYQFRRDFTARYGFSIPCQELVDAVKALNVPVISVGCGTAYTDRLFELAGIPIISTDPHPPRHTNNHYGFTHQYRKIRQYKGPLAVTKFPDHAVFMCWPNYLDSWACDTGYAMKPGTYLIYIGEGYDGCNATNDFHELLAAAYEEITYVPIPQFYGIHDSCYIYKKRGNNA